MINHIGYELVCDRCHEKYYTTSTNRVKLLNRAKADNWTEKYCPDCNRLPSDKVLRDLLSKGLTAEQIAERYIPYEQWLAKTKNGHQGLYEIEIIYDLVMGTINELARKQ